MISGVGIIAALIMTPLSIYTDGWPDFGANKATLSVLYLGAVPTSVASLMMVHIIRTAGTTFLSLVNYQLPLWAVAFGGLLLGEAMPPSMLTALVLILTGVGISQFAARRSKS